MYQILKYYKQLTPIRLKSFLCIVQSFKTVTFLQYAIHLVYTKLREAIVFKTIK